MVRMVVCQDPVSALAAAMLANYKNGTVGIVGNCSIVLQKQLIAQGNAIDCGKEFGEHIRYVVGVGNYEHIIKARELAVCKSLYLLPDIIDDICFAHYAANGYLNVALEAPETVFYTNAVSSLIRASAYASLLKLLSKCVDALAIYPTSSQLQALACQTKDMLLAPLDCFACANLIAKSSDIFGSINNGIIHYQTLLLRRHTITTDTIFFTNYLIMAAFIQFTKMDFNGIFIGKEKVLPSRLWDMQGTNNSVANSQTVRHAISKAVGGCSLQQYMQRYLWESGASWLKTDAKQIPMLIADAEESIKDLGMLGILCRIGLIDKIK